MDVLVEFCRSGRLGPLAKGSDAAQVEEYLGPPREVKWVQGDANWQRYKYGSLSLVLMSPTHDEKNHQVGSIKISFGNRPLDLPEVVSAGSGWQSSRVDDVLRILRESGVEPTLDHESTEPGKLQQHFRVEGGAVITAFDGELFAIQV